MKKPCVVIKQEFDLANIHTYNWDMVWVLMMS